MREALLEGITRAPPAVRVQLGECVRSLVYSDYPEQWPALLPQVHAYLTSQVRAGAARPCPCCPCCGRVGRGQGGRLRGKRGEGAWAGPQSWEQAASGVGPRVGSPPGPARPWGVCGLVRTGLVRAGGGGPLSWPGLPPPEGILHTNPQPPQTHTHIQTQTPPLLPSPPLLPGQDQARIAGALAVLRFLARKYEFRDEEERAPLDQLVNTTFPVLLQIFQVRGAGIAGWHIHVQETKRGGGGPRVG